MCRVPDWPEVPPEPPWRDCDGDPTTEGFCATARDMATQAAVHSAIAGWRDIVLACPGVRVGGVTGTFRRGMELAGVGPALSRLAASLGPETR